MDLTEFLLARVAEDEAVALRAVRWSEGASKWADAGEPDWEHIARHDPTRVLAECEAKRRIVDDWCAYETGPLRDEAGSCSAAWAMHRTLRALVLPYADHPDYRPEWSPTATAESR